MEPISNLPMKIRELLFYALDILIKDGARGCAKKGFLEKKYVDYVDELYQVYGGKFRLPPPNAPMFLIMVDDNTYYIEIPLWIEGENEPSELFAHMEINSKTKKIKLASFLVP